MGERRARAERALAERARRHDELAQHVDGAGSAQERLELRGEQSAAAKHALAWRMRRTQEELSALGTAGSAEEGQQPAPGGEETAALEAELAQIGSRLESELREELEGL